MLNQETKKKLIIISILILILVGAYFSWQGLKSDLVVDNLKDVKEVTLQGEVIAIQNGRITLKTGVVRKTSNGNQFVEEEKILIIESTTQFYITNRVQTAPSRFENIKVGDSIVAYSDRNVLNEKEFVPIKVVLNDF